MAHGIWWQDRTLRVVVGRKDGTLCTSVKPEDGIDIALAGEGQRYGCRFKGCVVAGQQGVEHRIWGRV